MTGPGSGRGQCGGARYGSRPSPVGADEEERVAEQRRETCGAEEALMTRIGQAVVLHRGGDREEARHRLAGLWAETADDGTALFHRCTIAHYLADTQDDPVDELAWDRRALATADALSGEGAGSDGHASAVRALYPSLHLNLAADHVRLRDAPAARRELSLARGKADVLEHDAYGRGVRDAVERLEVRLAALERAR